MSNYNNKLKDKKLEEITNQIRLDFRKLSLTKSLTLVDVKDYFVQAYNRNPYIKDNYEYEDFFDEIITINGLSENHQKFLHGDLRYVNSFRDHPSTVKIVHVMNHEDL